MKDRAGRLLERELATFAETHPRSRALAREGARLASRRRPDALDDAVGRRLPGLRRRSVGRAVPRRRRDRVRRPLPRRHGGDDRAFAGAGRPGGRGAGGARDHADASERGCALGRRGADPAFRPGEVAVRADGDRREPVRAAARAPRHRPAEGAGLQLVLPRDGRRDVRDAAGRRRRRPRGQPRAARAARRDHARRRVERRRGARARARLRRRRLRSGRARTDEHRHRASRAWVSTTLSAS